MKNIRFWKSRFLVIGLIVAMNLSGCSDFKGEDLENKEYQSDWTNSGNEFVRVQ